MLRRVSIAAIAAIVLGVFVQTASADPVNAKNVQPVVAICGGSPVMVVVNGNGEFTPAHVVGTTAVFVPTAFDLTFTFTPTGGSTESETDTSAKAHQPARAVTCGISANLNTFTDPEGTFSIFGTVTGFFTPAN